MAAQSGRSIYVARQCSYALFSHHSRSYSSYQGLNHCSVLKEKLNFATEYRGIFIQKSLEHLLSFKDVKINKNNVERISINDPQKGQGVNEASSFLYDKIPPLKYSNPDISIVCTRDENIPWQVKVVLASGDEVDVQTTDRTAENIFSDLCNVICSR